MATPSPNLRSLDPETGSGDADAALIELAYYVLVLPVLSVVRWVRHRLIFKRGRSVGVCASVDSCGLSRCVSNGSPPRRKAERGPPAWWSRRRAGRSSRWRASPRLDLEELGHPCDLQHLADLPLRMT